MHNEGMLSGIVNKQVPVENYNKAKEFVKKLTGKIDKDFDDVDGTFLLRDGIVV